MLSLLLSCAHDSSCYLSKRCNGLLDRALLHLQAHLQLNAVVLCPLPFYAGSPGVLIRVNHPNKTLQ